MPFQESRAAQASVCVCALCVHCVYMCVYTHVPVCKHYGCALCAHAHVPTRTSVHVCLCVSALCVLVCTCTCAHTSLWARMCVSRVRECSVLVCVYLCMQVHVCTQLYVSMECVKWVRPTAPGPTSASPITPHGQADSALSGLSNLLHLDGPKTLHPNNIPLRASNRAGAESTHIHHSLIYSFTHLFSTAAFPPHLTLWPSASQQGVTDTELLLSLSTPRSWVACLRGCGPVHPGSLAVNV